MLVHHRYVPNCSAQGLPERAADSGYVHHLLLIGPVTCNSGKLVEIKWKLALASETSQNVSIHCPAVMSRIELFSSEGFCSALQLRSLQRTPVLVKEVLKKTA